MANLAPLLIGGLGLIQNQDSQRRANNAQNRANDYNSRAVAMEEDKYFGLTKPALERIFSLANSYDPAAEGRAGVEYAKTTTEDTIRKALDRYAAGISAGGGTPGQSTAHAVRAQGITNRAADPLRAFAAESAGNPTQKRISMLLSALGQAPAGGLSSTYFNASNNAAALGGGGGDFGSVSRLLSQALSPGGGLIPRGAGGRGDRRSQEDGMALMQGGTA